MAASPQPSPPGLASAAPKLVDPNLPTYVPRPAKPPEGARYVTPDGSIRMIGAEHVQTIVEGFDALFSRSHPGSRFLLLLKGTTTTMPALTHGVTLVAPMGRESSWAEKVPYKKIVGQEPVEVRVAHASLNADKLASSLGIYVNKANPIDRLTTEQVARIFSIDQAGGDFTHWGQLGLKGEWARRVIHPYGTPENTGFGEYMQEHHVAGKPFTPNLEPYDSTTEILKRVSEDPAGIGFGALGRLTPELKLVALADKEDGYYSRGTAEDVVAGKYPFGRYLLFGIRREPGKPVDPFVKEYMRLVLSKEGQQIIAAQADGYTPLSAREAAEQLAKLD